MIGVGDRIVAVRTSVADGLAGVIAGSEGAIAIDAGIDAVEGAAIAGAVRSLGREPDRVVYTHAHIDHAFGGSVFRGGEIIATRAARDHMAAQVESWAERAGVPAEQLAGALGWPTTYVDDDLDIDLGDRTVRILQTPGHAPGAVCIVATDERVLFGGDTVVTNIPPSFRDGNSGQMEGSLRRLAAMDFEVLVPGHGSVLRGRGAVRDAISWAAEYLAGCRAFVAERVSSEDVDAIVSAASYDRFIGDRLPRDRHRMEWRHEQTLRTIVAEMAGVDPA